MGGPGLDDIGRLTDAVALAIEAHAGQVRKGTSVPYVSHPLAVASLVIAHGGDVDQSIAALLHDTLEDTAVTAAELEARFGTEVRRLVEACTDTLKGDRPGAKSSWAARKLPYLERLRGADGRVALVAACDKRHNLEALVNDLRRDGPRYLDRFNAAPPQLLWYQEQVGEIFRGRIPDALQDELDVLLKALRELLPGVVAASPQLG